MDFAAVAIILFFALRGRRRGLIKTIAGILALIIAFTLAGELAKSLSPYISEKYVSPRIISTILPEAEKRSDLDKPADKNELQDIFSVLSISESVISDSISDFSNNINKSLSSAVSDISGRIAGRITYSVVFVVLFLVLLLLLTLLFKLLNLASKVPGINFINKILGLVLGAVLGYIIVVILTFLLLRLGIIPNAGLISDTVILNYLISIFPLKSALIA